MKTNKSFKKLISFFLSLITLLSLFSMSAFAEGNVETILTSNISAVPMQGTINVGVKLNITDPNGLSAIDNLQLNYDANAFDYYENNMPSKNFKVTASNGNLKINYNSTRTDLEAFRGTLNLQFTFRAKASAQMGDYKFSVSGYNFYSDVMGEFSRIDVKVATELPIKIAEGKSNNNKLKSLTIKNFKISPEFNSNVFDYTAGVPIDTKSIDIEAIAEDPGATVVIAGNTNLSKDINPVSVIVTAQDGSTQIYKISVKTGVTTDEAATADANTDFKAKAEDLEQKLKQANLRNLIIILILIFIIICLIAYLLIEKYGDKWFHHSEHQEDKEEFDDEDEDEEDNY